MRTNRIRTLAAVATITSGLALSTLLAPAASAGISTSPGTPPRPYTPVSPGLISVTPFVAAS